MTTYLCYDIKGIQAFIFKVPKLRYVIGGSALIDRFDRETVPQLRVEGADGLFAGGGRGAFACRDEVAADRVQRALIEAAHQIGADIAIGRGVRYSDAAHSADSVFPCLPDDSELDGHPCAVSGLWPVAQGTVHPWMRARVSSPGQHKDVLRRYERELLPGAGSDGDASDGVRLVDSLVGRKLDFFHDVSPDGESVDDPDHRAVALAAARALGGRNRWAVIAMDGNDMGSQFRTQHERALPDDQFVDWLRESSRSLDSATRSACRDGLQQVLNHWQADRAAVEAATVDGPDGPVVLLPVRPLLVGGDDVVVLCHVEHALTFVQEVCRSFSAHTRARNEAWKSEHGDDLWPATGGRLTISAGVLFAPVSLPLSSALPMAESLLASAKGEGRRLAAADASGPAPACLDWESITGSVVEHPAAARRRDRLFHDQDLDEQVALTQRPYALEDLAGLERLVRQYGRLPRTVLHHLRRHLRAPFWERRVLVARLEKHHRDLARDLAEPEHWESDAPSGRWTRTQRGGVWERSTDVLDAMDLLVEEARMGRQTVGA